MGAFGVASIMFAAGMIVPRRLAVKPVFVMRVGQWRG